MLMYMHKIPLNYQNRVGVISHKEWEDYVTLFYNPFNMIFLGESKIGSLLMNELIDLVFVHPKK
jgi:hypothetical protein